MKKIFAITVMLSLFVLSFAAPVLAKGGKSSGGFSRPSATRTSPTSPDAPASTQGTSTDKIPYTNLPASKAGGTAGTASNPGAGYKSFNNTSRGFMPSFTPFSGNFWLWMLLFNGFHHSAAPVAAAEGDEGSQAVSADPEIYKPGLGDYWNANPLANIVSTLILLAMIALIIVAVKKLLRRNLHKAPLR